MIWRTALLLSALVLAALSFHATDARAEKDPRKKAPNTGRPEVAVTIGDVKHVLLFEDPDIATEVRTTIGADIEQILRSVDNVAIETIGGKHRNVLERKYHLVLYQLTMPHYKRFLPEVLQNHFGVGIRLGSTYYLAIHEKVIHEYQKAHKLKQEHFEKFKRVDDFLALFNNRKARQHAAESIEGARRFFYFHEMEPWHAYQKYARDLGLPPGGFLRIAPPSLLDFRLAKNVSGLRFGKDMGNNVLFVSVVRFKEDAVGEERVEKVPFVYSDGQWRMLVYPMP